MHICRLVHKLGLLFGLVLLLLLDFLKSSGNLLRNLLNSAQVFSLSQVFGVSNLCGRLKFQAKSDAPVPLRKPVVGFCLDADSKHS